MKKHAPQRILLIVQRSNGDVFLSSPLIEGLFEAYGKPQIDLLVNSDTLAVAKMLPHVSRIHVFNYDLGRTAQTMGLIRKIARRYDLAISLTASDRSVLFALVAGHRAISAVEQGKKRSWWKRFLLRAHYEFDTGRHIIENNTQSLVLLGIDYGSQGLCSAYSPEAAERVDSMLMQRGIGEYIIFHPCAQYDYKVYPEELRNKLLEELARLGPSIVVTGSKSSLDQRIKSSLPSIRNVHDFIGETSIAELFALSNRSLAYIGADTLNMHIAASQNKRIFAIFGPTILSMWSPWSNELHSGAKVNKPVQTYGNITLFQADMPCAGCGKTGCDDHHGPSECLYRIDPFAIKQEVELWLRSSR
ncbi:MAG: lipopolysaccharide heptosyltransferase [Chlorobiaceae bacterium]|nr:lipopolysaccharide heptosyltransferase [Chlorobiaceae bacterium]